MKLAVACDHRGLRPSGGCCRCSSVRARGRRLRLRGRGAGLPRLRRPGGGRRRRGARRRHPDGRQRDRHVDRGQQGQRRPGGPGPRRGHGPPRPRAQPLQRPVPGTDLLARTRSARSSRSSWRRSSPTAGHSRRLEKIQQLEEGAFATPRRNDGWQIVRNRPIQSPPRPETAFLIFPLAPRSQTAFAPPSAGGRTTAPSPPATAAKPVPDPAHKAHPPRSACLWPRNVPGSGACAPVCSFTRSSPQCAHGCTGLWCSGSSSGGCRRRLAGMFSTRSV